METVAALFLFVAAVAGFMAFVHQSMDMKIPRMIRMIHIAAVALGILSLIIYALTTGKPEKHYNIMIMLGIALIPGMLLLMGSFSAASKKAMAVVYGLTGMFALLWLLTIIIPQ